LAGYTSTVAQISGDDRLTPEAKAVDLAKAHTKAQTDLSGVRATVEQQEAETVERLASSVFGNPASTGADVIAARDADDRAARYTTPEEAQLALSRTEAKGDKSLARSIALRAYQETQGPFGGGAWHFASNLTSSDPRIASPLGRRMPVAFTRSPRCIRQLYSGPLIGPVDPWRFPAGSLINGGNLLVGLARFELATP